LINSQILANAAACADEGRAGLLLSMKMPKHAGMPNQKHGSGGHGHGRARQGVRSSPRLAAQRGGGREAAPAKTIKRSPARGAASRGRSRVAAGPRAARPRPRPQQRTSSRVKVHVYHVSNEDWVKGMNEWLPQSVLGGVYHAGVEVWGKEYWFGWCPPPSSGVTACAPKRNLAHTYFKSVDVGMTQLSRDDIDALVAQLKSEWQGQHYNAIKRNCCHFCEDMLERLGVGGLPSWVNRLARVSDWWGIDGSWLLASRS